VIQSQQITIISTNKLLIVTGINEVITYQTHIYYELLFLSHLNAVSSVIVPDSVAKLLTTDLAS